MLVGVGRSLAQLGPSQLHYKWSLSFHMCSPGYISIPHSDLNTRQIISLTNVNLCHYISAIALSVQVALFTADGRCPYISARLDHNPDNQHDMFLAHKTECGCK